MTQSIYSASDISDISDSRSGKTIVDPQLEEIICNNCETIISENIQDDPDQSDVLLNQNRTMITKIH